MTYQKLKQDLIDACNKVDGEVDTSSPADVVACHVEDSTVKIDGDTQERKEDPRVEVTQAETLSNHIQEIDVQQRGDLYPDELQIHTQDTLIEVKE